MKNSKKTLLPIINLASIVLLLLTWINILLIHGIPGAVSWMLALLVFPPAGVILLLFSTIYLLRKIVEKKSIIAILVTGCLSLLFTFPLLITLNILPIAYPVDIETMKPTVTIHSPFKENATIGWGGDQIQYNKPHAIIPSERWAYDILMEPYSTGSVNLEDYGIYQKKVFSPIAGRIIAVYDGEENIPPGSEEFLSMEGNYIYIEIESTGTYLLLNHLLKDSIKVKVGDLVAIGDYLGQVGNSGSTSEPHLHIHHQRQNPLDTIHPTIAEGLPLYFYNSDMNFFMPVSGEEIN